MNGNIHNDDPTLDSLADNGGPTQTHALQTGSPAIDATRGLQLCPACGPCWAQRRLPRLRHLLLSAQSARSIPLCRSCKPDPFLIDTLLFRGSRCKP
ncbi:choice-of-anchor Q domain-containing protein [Chloroflexota bacterium]